MGAGPDAVTGPAPIPRILHVVWFGPDPAPQAWIDTWREKHPRWRHELWNETRIAALGLENEDQWLSLVRRGIWDAASDVARIEVLYRFGGVYVDADSVCLAPLDDAPFLRSTFFATEEIQPNGKPFVTNAFMGCVPRSDLARRYIDHIRRVKVRCLHGGEGAGFCCAWKTTGPLALTQLVRGTDAVIAPASAFFTKTIMGQPIEGKHYAQHFWSSTTARSPKGMFAGQPYQEGAPAAGSLLG